MSKLALLGGKKAVRKEYKEMFKWPIITKEMEDAVLEVLRAGKMSDLDISTKFAEEFAEWHGMKYAVPCNNGTAAIHCAMFGLGIGKGDEIICPSLTYWASCLQVYSLGGTVRFADIEADTLCIDPIDIERKITSRTKAIVVVHYAGMPADMNRIIDIARKYKIKILEDVSHAHGALYKGKMCGSLGDVAGFSLMTGKSFAIGEGGIMLTNDRRIYERALLFGHYARHGEIKSEELASVSGLPYGGYKYRMHQLSAVIGRIQIKRYPEQMEEIDKAMNYFWDCLEGLPGIKAHRPPEGSGNTKGGWYYPLGFYVPEELGGLSITQFCRALKAEGFPASPGANKPLHTHPLFRTVDVYNDNRPTRIASLSVDSEIKDELPVTEKIKTRLFSVPWFKHFDKSIIDQYVEAMKKVVKGYKELLKTDPGDAYESGGWSLSLKNKVNLR